MPDIFDEVEVPETDIFDQVSMDGPSPSTARDTGITVGAQFAQAPQVIAQTLDESGAQTMAGFNYLRARLIREGVRKPVDETSGTGNIRDYISLAGEEPDSFYAPQRGQTMDAFVKAEEARGKAVLEEGQFYSRAAEELPQKYGLNPDLESGLVTQVVRGLTKGAAIAAMAEVGGIPALALQGATEAYGAARSGGANDNEAIDQSVKTLIGLAVFGASNKAVASGISKYIGDAPKLQTFLTQALGQSAGNELTSRVITAWESAVEAPPDQRAEAALAALAESDAGAIAQNIGFGVMGASGASRRAISKARRESSNRLPEVEMENQLRAVREEEQAKASALRPSQFTGPMAQSRLEVAAETRNVVPETEVLGASADPMAIIAPPDDKKKGKITQLISDRQKTTDPAIRERLMQEALRLQRLALEVTEPPVPEPLAPPSEAPLPFPLEAPKPSPVSEQAKLDALLDLTRPKAPEAPAPPPAQTTGKSTPAETAPRPQEKEVAASSSEAKPLTDKEKARMQTLRDSLEEMEAERKFAADEGDSATVASLTKVQNKFRTELEALEDRLPPDAPRTTGIRNAITDEVAASMGLPERGTPERYSAEQQLADAQKAISDNPKLGEVIVTELAESPRALDALENNVMAFEFAARQTEFNAATKAVLSAKTPEAQMTAELRVQKARDAVQELIEATRATGTLQGRALESRKRLVEQQYELPVMQAEAQIAKGRPLTKAEASEIEALHKELESVKAELAKRDTQTAEKEAERTLSNLIREETRAARSAKKTGRSFMDVLKEGHDKALKNIRERSGRTSAGVDPTVLADVARIGAYKIAQGVVKIADFTRDMVRDIGEWVRPSIDDIFTQSQKLHAEANKAYTSANARPVAIEKAQASATKGEALPQQVVYEMAREKVNAGLKSLDEVMDAVTADLQQAYPGISVREVRDAFSGYGKVKFPSKAEDLTKLRELRRLGQLASAIEDAQKGQRPKKSGSQRDDPTPEVLSKMAELRDAMDAAGIETKDSAQDLKSRLSTNKKLVANRIKELERRIRESDYSKAIKREPATDKDLIDLRFREAKLKEQYLADLFLDRMKKRTWSEKTVDAVWEVAGLSRVLTTAYDIGALLNQGKMLLGRPVIYGKAVAHMFRSISEKGEFRAQKEMEARDNFKNGNYKTAKLALTDPNAVSLSKVEEDFQSRWANKIPGIKQSNRAYSSFLNRLRMDTFDAMLDSWFPGGASKKDMQDMAALVNDATGRGSLGKTIEPAAPLLNRLFFAAKYQTARLSIMTGYRLLKPGISWQVRKAIAAEYGRIILGLSAYYGLLIAMQDDKDPRVGLNPLKKDTFLTIRYGDTRLNPVGPIKGWLANESQMAAGKKIDKDGKTMKLSPIQKQLQDSSFVRSKFSPALGNFVDWRWGSTFSGEPFRMFPENVDQLMKGESVAPGAFTPMSVSNVYETLKAHRSAKGIALSILGVAGESENTYPDKDKK